MSDATWYYDDAGRQAGPVTVDDVAKAIRSGRLAPGARVWSTGMAGWQPWETVPELVACRVGGPPPLDAPLPAPFSRNSYAGEVLAGSKGRALYPKAPFGSRFAAAILDHLVSSVPVTLLLLAAIAASKAALPRIMIPLAILASLAGVWAIWYAFTKDGRAGGQSIGKKAVGLMVVHLPTHLPCTTRQSALRYLVLAGLGLIPYVGWLVEPIVTLAAAGGRRLGDSAAGTQVIAAAEFRPRG